METPSLKLLCIHFGKVLSQKRDEFCDSRRDGLIYPDPDDCRAYVYCSGGTAYRSHCLSGLYYEPSLQACEFDNRGRCLGNTERNELPPPPKVVKPSFPGPRSETFNNAIPAMPNVPEREVFLDYGGSFDAGDFCKDRSDGTYDHPTVCHGYLLCSNGLPFEALCPDGLVYSRESGGCDYDYEGVCSAQERNPEIERPFKSIKLTKDLSRLLSQLMPQAVESAMEHLTESLQKEAKLALTLTGRPRPFKQVQRFLKAKPLAKQLSMTAFVINDASDFIVNELRMGMKDSMKVLDNIPSPLPSSNIRLQSDAVFPQPQPGTCPWPLYDCKINSYRSYDGSCNNLQKPLWGRAFTPFRRFLKPVYADGLGKLRNSVDGSTLPSARLVSTTIADDVDRPHHHYTLMGAMQWGQFMDHDLDLTAISTIATEPTGYGATLDIECGDSGCNDTLYECEPIKVPNNDPDFGGKQECLEFVRSEDTPNLDCSMGPREQLNQITSYLDGSQVYGSTKTEAENLRDMTDLMRGKLKMSQHPFSASVKSLLPRETDHDECVDASQIEQCFKAGDSRVNEQMGLTVLHTLWMREHNGIENELHHYNPHWDGEKLYQETRRIIGAMMQHITYNEFLPIILGSKQLKLFGLELLDNEYYAGYDYSVDVSIANVFAASAFRFGHSLLQPTLKRADTSYNTTVYKPLFLSSILNRPHSVYDLQGGGMDSIVRGLASQPIQNFDHHITNQVTKHLFTDTPPMGMGMDLVSLNIQRGRDHGLPGYNAWREWCGLTKIENFDNLIDIKDAKIRQKLKTIYSSVDDIDLFPAGISERPVEGGLVGPTFSCIIARQFQNLRKGDRFWYENDGAFRFSPEQIAQLRKVTLAKVLCNNGDSINTIQPRVMELPFREVYPQKSPASYDSDSIGLDRDWFSRLWDSNYNARVSCGCLPDLDLKAWRES